MAVNGVTETNPIQQLQAKTQTSNDPIGMDGLGQGAFMQLLLAQLKNQDPLKPMDNTEFISQMAQFNSLNELMSLNKTMGELMTAQLVTQGSSMIGKEVTANLDTGDTVTGTVSAMQIRDNNVTLTVNGTQVPMSAVRTVAEAQTSGQGGGSAVW